MAEQVVVVGGGLAGISAAIDLAEAGLPVCLVEARPWLGGATCSFGRRGLTVDNGQHVFFRHWTAYLGLLAKLGVAESAAIQDRLDLTVLTAQARGRVRRSALPPPLHLAASIARYRLLTPAERLNLAPAVLGLHEPAWSAAGATGSEPGSGDRPADRCDFAQWLSRHRQGDRARRMFWEPLCVAALNADVEQADAHLARAFLSGLLAGRENADLGTPSVPFCQLHGNPAASLLRRLGAEVLVGRKVGAIRPDRAGGYQVFVEGADERADDELPFERDEPEMISAAAVVLAVPAWQAAELAPAELAADAAGWAKLGASPIVSMHVVYGSQVTELPFAVVADCPARWVIDKTVAAGLHAGQYLAVSIPAADRYVDAPAGVLREECLQVLSRLFPAAADASVEDFFVTRERRATIRQLPGSGSFRAAQITRLPGLAVAGAWTDTGMPDCMEGAVRSGQLAARAVISALAGTALAAPTAGGTEAITELRPAS